MGDKLYGSLEHYEHTGMNTKHIPSVGVLMLAM